MKLIGRITKGQPVYTRDDADTATLKFAKAYLASRKGGWRQGGATAKDEAAEASFHYNYSLAETVRSGFAGSGEWVYRTTTKVNSAAFRVHATVGSGDFWATDTYIERVA